MYKIALFLLLIVMLAILSFSVSANSLELQAGDLEMVGSPIFVLNS